MGLGYKAMMIIEAGFRRMKTTAGIRPVYHWTAHRITSHIRLCAGLVAGNGRRRAVWGIPGATCGLLSARSRPCATGSMGSRWQEHALNGASAGLPQKARREAPPPRVLSIEKPVCTLLQYLDTRVERPVCNALTFYAVPWPLCVLWSSNLGSTIAGFSVSKACRFA